MLVATVVSNDTLSEAVLLGAAGSCVRFQAHWDCAGCEGLREVRCVLGYQPSHTRPVVNEVDSLDLHLQHLLGAVEAPSQGGVRVQA